MLKAFEPGELRSCWKKVVTRAAAETRLTPASLDRLLAKGILWRMHPGVYAVAYGPPKFLVMLAGTQAWLGDEACISGRTALYLHRVDGCEARVAEFTVPRTRRNKSAPGVRIHSAQVRPQDVVVIEGFRCMTIARALVHLCEIGAEPKQIMVAYEDNFRRSARHREALKECVEAHRSGRDLSVLDELMSRRNGDTPPTDSAAEAIADDILWRNGIRAVRQYVVRDLETRTYARLDLAFPHLRLAVEIDGWEFHRVRRRFAGDRRIDRRLKQVGWDVERFVWEDLQNERTFVDEVRALLRARRDQLRLRMDWELESEQLGLPF